MTWLETNSNEDARLASVKYWNNTEADLGKEVFWADKIKKLKSEPAKRLATAMENLPLPGAFREAAVALRSQIRTKRKEKSEFQTELTLLYWLAAIDSFSIPYSSYLKQPGFNVMESIPGKVIKTLQFNYYEVGYEELALLNKTDIKWIVEFWGEPNNHTTLNELHNDIWKKYEKELPIKQKKDLDEMFSKLGLK